MPLVILVNERNEIYDFHVFLTISDTVGFSGLQNPCLKLCSSVINYFIRCDLPAPAPPVINKQIG